MARLRSNPDVARVSGVLAGAPFPWWVAGGWALDLFMGATIRPHGDIDVAILRRDQARLRSHLPGWEIRVAVPERGLLRWPEDQWLDPPLHGLWAKPAGEVPWACEFLLNDASETDWVYRRDPRITYPLPALIASTSHGIPCLPPEIVLLYKSKNPRPEDEMDFRAVRPHLTPPAIDWLSRALTLIDPGHPWFA